MEIEAMKYHGLKVCITSIHLQGFALIPQGERIFGIHYFFGKQGSSLFFERIVILYWETNMSNNQLFPCAQYIFSKVEAFGHFFSGHYFTPQPLHKKKF